jgi:hypothetical protein
MREQIASPWIWFGIGTAARGHGRGGQHIRLQAKAGYGGDPRTRTSAARTAQPAYAATAEDLPYALLSAAAYGAIRKEKPDKEAPSIDAARALENSGWAMWRDFPTGTLQTEMERVHLRVQVWSNEQLGAVVIAFGGTVFSNWKDWRSNLR